MKTYLPVILIVGGVHIAVIFALTIASNLSARSRPVHSEIHLPTEALQKDCGLHRAARTAGAAQVTYGHAFPREYLEANRRFFPNAWFYIDGGTTAAPDSPRQATVQFCPSCRAAAQRWHAQLTNRSPS